MLETIDNLIQLLAALLGCTVSGVQYLKRHRQGSFLLSSFYCCFALGLLYWTLYLLLYRETPGVFYVSEIVWISGCIFLSLLQYVLSSREERAFRCPAMWAAYLAGVALAALFCFYGNVMYSLLSCGMMTMLSSCSIRGLAYWMHRGGRQGRALRRFHITVLCFVAAEYCLWTSSLHWQGDSLANPYFWFDFMLTGTLIVLLPAAGKAVEA